MDDQLSPVPAGEGVVSVVVVNWNRRDLLRACLASLANQNGVPLEVILVDNGSSDDSVAMARGEFGETGRLRLETIENRENKGFCEANNQGIARARGAFIALLNNDAEASPDWARALREAFTDPAVGMAASKILVWDDPTRIDKVGHLIYWDGQNRGRGTGEIDRGQYDRIEEVAWPDGCAAMYRRSMLAEIGGFDEDFFAYADDAELGLRARIAGWKCLYIPRAVVRHHRGQTLGQISTRRIELIERNRVLLAAKLFPWSLLWLNGAYYLARIAAGAAAAARNRGDVSRFPGLTGKWRLAKALIRADLEALTMVPRMLRKRPQVNRIRKLSSSELKQLLKRYRIPLRELMEQSQ
ncbi:MAG: glycosyltransferase family 2 protein [Bryobacteraceae bacterium]